MKNYIAQTATDDESHIPYENIILVTDSKGNYIKSQAGSLVDLDAEEN